MVTVPIPEGWLYELSLPAGDYKSMIDIVPPRPGDDVRDIHLRHPASTAGAGLRKLFTFNAGGLPRGVVSRMYAHYFEGRPWDNQQVWHGLDPADKDVWLVYTHLPAIPNPVPWAFYVQFLPQEEGVALPDGPGLICARIPNPGMAEASPPTNGAEEIPPTLIKYFARDNRHERFGIKLVDEGDEFACCWFSPALSKVAFGLQLRTACS